MNSWTAALAHPRFLDLDVLNLATAKPNRDPRPGQLVSSLRRARAGQAVGGDQKAGGS